ncbi:DNA topology modulation protein FlaR [Cognatiyoonia sp. IB215182]|uniref:DNA topology modulation protein FlaR n=1 Tax=Cognatiyoonia sp. IB215182 TaxID=3097353 RepID=UPI002A12DF9D|nr:DNA topology modulation protein FlaR [Cognatiyoonia sp. IB215182]MDX8352111.1 DNA topology modulation protein FlaR [Cognatiyoonia sp. IB215182]
MNTKPSDFGGLYFLDIEEVSGTMLDRVVIVGANGAGKTWLAQHLGTALDASVIHKDALALMSGWRQRPRSEVQAALCRAVQEDRWILDGGPSILGGPVLARATLVIWLDVPGPLRAWRVFSRSVHYFGRVRPEHPTGNRDWPGPRQMRFLWRALTGGASFRRAIVGALADTDIPVLRLTKRAEIRVFLQQLAL